MRKRDKVAGFINKTWKRIALLSWNDLGKTFGLQWTSDDDGDDDVSTLVSARVFVCIYREDRKIQKDAQRKKREEKRKRERERRENTRNDDL